MTLAPLLALAVSASAAQPAPAVAEPESRLRTVYNLPNPRRHDAYIAITDIQGKIRYPDGASIGGANHAEDILSGVCAGAPGECLVLLEQARDMILEQGDAVSPHIYGVLYYVLVNAGANFKTIKLLDKALWDHSGRVSGAPQPTYREASTAALEVLRHMLASKKTVNIKTWNGSVAALGALIAHQFEDSAVTLEADMKALLASQDKQTLMRVIPLLGDRARNRDTALRLAGLFLEQEQGRRTMDDEVQALALDKMADVVRTVWPSKLDYDMHPVWMPEEIAAGRNYFTLACALQGDRGCGTKDQNGQYPSTPVCVEARELQRVAPKQHKAVCDNTGGRPQDDYCTGKKKR
jgi:hypothetical protein